MLNLAQTNSSNNHESERDYGTGREEDPDLFGRIPTTQIMEVREI